MMDPEKLRAEATAVLRDNDRGQHTIPSAGLYPHQWAWDSGFAAIGWSTIDTDRALAEIERLLGAQWHDGRIPHIVFDPSATDYFPGPAFWEHAATSTITNPPVWTLALRTIAERGGDPHRIAALLPTIEASHRFFAAARDPLGWGGVAVAHPWESGRDNCPAWDGAMSAVRPEDAPPFKRVDKAKVADPSQRPTDDQYKRYAVLVKAIAAAHFGPGPFAVYDPFMTAILARADRDLLYLAQRFDVDTEAAHREQAALACLENKLWDQDLGRCQFFDVSAGRYDTPNVLAAYAPLICSHERLAEACEQSLADHFANDCGLPTVAPSAELFDPRCYWRGPCWLSTNWLYATGASPAFRDELSRKSVDLVERSGFWEYFDPTTGDGLGTAQFTWTAALTLDMLARRVR
jgi:glycogen debranching enzyme